jgi:putative transposase
MKSVVKIGLEVTEAQAAILDSQSKIANWLYNKLLETANDLRQQYRAAPDQERRDQIGLVLYTERGLRNLIPGLKREHPFLKVVYSSVLKNAALRLSKAIRDYQDGKHGRRANQVNWPTFRAWKRSWFSLQYDEPHKGYRLAGRTLTLVLGQDVTGKQLTIDLQLAEALPIGSIPTTFASAALSKKVIATPLSSLCSGCYPMPNRCAPTTLSPWTPITRIVRMR